MKTTAGLVLSGGGALGIAHIGALEKLIKSYHFDYICGVSAGAIVGAALAIGKTPEDIWHIFNDTNLWSMAFDLSPKNSGLVKGEKIYELLADVYEDKSFSDLDVPLEIGTTDFNTGEAIMINQGKIVDAVRASIAIPIVFEPHPHPLYQKPLVDGFLSKNFPIEHALKQYQGQKIIGIDVATVPPLEEDFGKAKFWGRNKVMFNSLQRMMRIMYHNQNSHVAADPRLTIYEPDLQEFSSMSLGKKNFKQIRQKGREAIGGKNL